MLDRHLEPFLSNLKSVRQLSPHTISNYQRDIFKFFSFLNQEKSSWEVVDKQSIREFISKERRRGLRMLTHFFPIHIFRKTPHVSFLDAGVNISKGSMFNPSQKCHISP